MRRKSRVFACALSVNHVYEALDGIPPRMIENAIKSGALPAYGTTKKQGGIRRTRVLVSDIEKWIRAEWARVNEV